MGVTMANLIKLSRKLRQGMTEAEKKIWYVLQKKNIKGYKFRRQAPIGTYIVDFVCFQKKLIVEIDGGQHADSSTDKIRDEWLRGEGFIVLRFWNNEALQNTEGVVSRILEYL